MGFFVRGSDTKKLAISTASAEVSSALDVGVEYWLTSDVDCFFRMGPTSATATTSDAPLLRGVYLQVSARKASEAYLQAITAAGSGNLYLIPIGS